MIKSTSFTTRSKLATGVATAAIGLALATTPAYAQEDPQSTEEASSGPIVVTGTRIQRPDLESVSPVTVVGAQDIAATGTTRAEDLLNALPQVFASQTAFISNGGTGTATVDLRGLGAIRTLVLVDGRRLQPGDPFAVTADINQIPASLIERVDVVTGGASAVYGADAVSGVVNFIMDRDFEGIRADAQASFYQHNNDDDVIQDLLNRRGFISPNGTPVDGWGYDANVVIGAGFDDGRGHVTGYLGYRQIDAITQDTRDYSACALAFSATDPSGYICSGSSTTVAGTFFLFNDGSTPFNGGAQFTIDPTTGGFRPYVSARDAYNFNPTNFFQRPDKRYVGGFFAEYEISPSVVPYTEFMFMDDRSDAQIAASGTFFANTFFPTCGHPLINDLQYAQLGCTSDDQELTYFYTGKRLVEAGPRTSILRHTTHREVLGVRGSISENWSYDAYLQRGETIYGQRYINDVSIPNVDQALDAVVDANGNIVCRDQSNGCIPLNVFEIGGVTAEQADFITVPALMDASIKQYVASGFITGSIGNLWHSNPVGVVVGVEYRKELYDLNPDSLFEIGGLAGQGGPTVPVEGAFSVREVFAEIIAPLVEFGNGGGIELQAGYRYSDYTTTGGAHTYKGGLTIEPVPGVSFRGIYNRAVRAPNIVELFSPQQIGLFNGIDRCAGENPEASAAACANTGVTAAQYGNIAPNPADQYNQLTGGNPNLDPEKADTYTVGMVVDASDFGLPGFTATVDYFLIEIGGAIQGLGAQAIFDGCLNSGDALLCSNVQRGVGGTLWLGQTGFIQNLQLNIGDLSTEGIDFGLGYRFPVGAGSLFANITGTYLLEAFASSNGLDCVGFYGPTCTTQWGGPVPEYRHRVSLGYTSDSGWGVTTRWRYFGSVEIEPGASTVATVDDSIKAFHWFDVSGSYDFTDNFSLTAGVNNVFDTNPPTIGGAFLGTAGNGNTFPGQYDPVGRYVFVRGAFEF
ncbi:MAG: TonB-dependent receptor [Sphingomonadaceae bacterium]|nr:TonB-dependent receptor [Sphingomonadaceae bacterium]